MAIRCILFAPILICALSAPSTASLAQAPAKPRATPSTTAAAQPRQKAGVVTKKSADRQIIKGKFTLDKILLEQDQKRQLWFKGRGVHGKALSLVLVSRYTHPELRPGRSYQMAAEVGAKRPGYLLLNKALVYFSGSSGNGSSGSGASGSGASGGGTTIPVWIMADHANLTLDVEKYLKMHAPTSDYLVM